MELKIIHFYPDLMSLYGSYANVSVLRRYLEALGCAVTVQAVVPGEGADITSADFLFMGAGTERAQRFAAEDFARYSAAVKAAGLKFPVSRVTVNLAPAALKKEGTVYDLPILVGLLSADGAVPPPPQDAAFPVDKIPRRHGHAQPLKHRRIVALRHKADVLAVALLRHGKRPLACQLAHGGLAHLLQR